MKFLSASRSEQSARIYVCVCRWMASFHGVRIQPHKNDVEQRHNTQPSGKRQWIDEPWLISTTDRFTPICLRASVYCKYDRHTLNIEEFRWKNRKHIFGIDWASSLSSNTIRRHKVWTFTDENDRRNENIRRCLLYRSQSLPESSAQLYVFKQSHSSRIIYF